MLKFSFRQKIFAGFIFYIVFVLVICVLCYQNLSQFETSSEEIFHTQSVIKTNNDLLQFMIDAETGMRGYVATGNKVFINRYKTSIPFIDSVLAALKKQLQNKPELQKKIDGLFFYVRQEAGILKQNIDSTDIKRPDSLAKNTMLLNGKYSMDKVRLITGQIISSEKRVLEFHRAKLQEASKNMILVIAYGVSVFLVILILFFVFIQGTFARQKKIENEIKNANLHLETVLIENKAKNWLLTGAGLLNEKILGVQSERTLAESILTEICSYTKAFAGTLYFMNDEKETLELYASFAFHDINSLKKTIKLGEGWVGQVAKDQKTAIIKGTLNENLEITSSLIRQSVIESYIVPFFFDKKLKGIIEIAFDNIIEKQIDDYILIITDIIGVAVNTSQQNTTMRALLSQVQQQAEELQAQQEEMRVTNEELLSKTEMLKASEEELRVQQEELRTTNAELQEKAGLLEEKNKAVEEARYAINLKVKELEITGKYKSEFLANMSHELRTPLNSILVLARILKDNKPKNLTEDQIKYSSVIFNAGNDLLALINDILDLSKIESGKLEMQNEAVKITEVVNDMEMMFAQLALNKKIKYTANIAENLPENIFTDKVRVEQVLKNLLSNAFKFTSEGGSISINVVPGNENQTVSFCIKDSGIGIPPEKQKIIFEAFQQADGSTSRKYGGTGLGLSISRELVNLLGGKIGLTSEPGIGSEFVLTLPFEAHIKQQEPEYFPQVENVLPDISMLKPVKHIIGRHNKEPLVVIVEDDRNFADILHTYARDHGYKPVLVYDGTHAVEIIKENQPDAVILDIMLPGKDGWQILKELKQDEGTGHIPVHLMSANEAADNKVKKEGAISFIKKPIDTATLDKLFGDLMQKSGTQFKQILLIEDNKTQSNALNELMSSHGITVDQAFDGESAFLKLNENEYQCIILDLNLPDVNGLDFLDKIKQIERFKELPVIINTAMELDKTSVSRLMQYANAMVVKTSKSADRLIDEINLFLNKVSETANQPARPSSPKNITTTVAGKDALKGKKILIVDDDMRNIYALSSALQSYDMLVEIANDGKEAIEKLELVSGIDMVLMDIMMPKMDGYEATRYIRTQTKWAMLPIIALTAKAMMDDREKCIAAGANDYITKPVDVDRLISLIQLWLGR